MGKMAWFYCSSVLYVVLEHFYVNLITVFEKINVFLINTVSGQVSVIADVMVFSEKLAVIHWKNGLILLKFCTLFRFKAFLCDFNRQFSKKSFCFYIHCFRPR